MRARSDFTGLVVEDEWLLRLELAEELTAAGWTILEAVSGEDALAILTERGGAEGGKIDFLVTDIRLGGAVDGWQVAQQAREAFPDLPVIYVSANPIQETRRVPGSVFMGKPCDVAQLLKTCEQLVKA